jgi:hypothetical protein
MRAKEGPRRSQHRGSGHIVAVVDPGKGVCADPVNRDAILEKGGTGPKGGDKERQLSPDRDRDKT